MTPISGWLNPEARATLDAVFAKLQSRDEHLRSAASRP